MTVSKHNRISDRAVAGYADKCEVAADLRYATEVMHQHGWRLIDVTYTATEGVASKIIEMISSHERRRP